MAENGTYDAVVVGAGAAGLSAGRALAQAGRRVVVLEAKNRVGGRAYTSTRDLDLPFDHGAHWLHSGSVNPLVSMAENAGFDISRVNPPQRFWHDDGWADTSITTAWQDYVDAQWRAIDAAAAISSEPSTDLAVRSVIDADVRWLDPFLAWFAMLSSVEAAAVSVQDHARYRDTRENWPVPQGLGAVVATLADGLPVRLSCPVTRIDWRGPQPVVDTAQGQLSARTVIVTASTSVLAGGGIRFAPDLPHWKQEAINALPLGNANKVALRFDRNVFGDGVPCTAMPLSAGREIFRYQIRPFGEDVAIGFAGGDFAAAIEALTDDEVCALALEQLATMFGSDITGHVTHRVRTAWRADPFVRGAYSAARPGQAGARSDLRRPVDGRIFFAGEAVSSDFYSTVHGAYLSGHDVAADVERQLAKA